jgi:hypothetical protein
MLNEPARSIIKYLAQDALLVENISKRPGKLLKARCNCSSFACDIVEYSRACDTSTSRQKIEHEVFFRVMMLIEERLEIINHLTEKVVIGSFGSPEPVTFLFEDTQNLLNLAVITAQRLNNRSHVSWSWDQHLALNLARMKQQR